MARTSPFSPCKNSSRRRSDDFSFVEAAKILMTLSVLVVFGLAHVGLRSRLTRMRQEINSLQSAQADLLAQTNVLKIDNEALKTPKSVQDYARAELGMISCDAMTRETLAMPGDTRAQYALARAEAERMTSQAQPGAEKAQDAATDRLLALMSEQVARTSLAGNAVAAGVQTRQDATSK